MLLKPLKCLVFGYRKGPFTGLLTTSEIYFQTKHTYSTLNILNSMVYKQSWSSSLHKHSSLLSPYCSSLHPDRKFSSSSPLRGRIPPLMEFPPLHLPKITNTIRNTLLSSTLIRPYFDKDFTVKEFVQGAKFAALQVSQNLSSGDLNELEGSCTSQCLNEIKKNLSLFSMKERSELELNEGDIIFSFLYQIGVLMDDEPDENGAYGRQVECTWVGHAFKNYLEIVEETGGNLREIKDVMEKERGPTILNFRFIRNYSKGVEDSWTVNALNYFKILR